jgi:hypothetical protein
MTFRGGASESFLTELRKPYGEASTSRKLKRLRLPSPTMWPAPNLPARMICCLSRVERLLAARARWTYTEFPGSTVARPIAYGQRVGDPAIQLPDHLFHHMGGFYFAPSTTLLAISRLERVRSRVRLIIPIQNHGGEVVAPEEGTFHGNHPSRTPR